MAQQQQLAYDNKFIYATLPRTQPMVFGSDPKGKNILYIKGNSVIIRNIESPAIADVYTEHSCAVNVAKYSASGLYIASGEQNVERINHVLSSALSSSTMCMEKKPEEAKSSEMEVLYKSKYVCKICRVCRGAKLCFFNCSHFTCIDCFRRGNSTSCPFVDSKFYKCTEFVSCQRHRSHFP